MERFFTHDDTRHKLRASAEDVYDTSERMWLISSTGTPTGTGFSVIVGLRALLAFELFARFFHAIVEAGGKT